MEIKRYGGNGRMSSVVVYNNTVYLSGQVGSGTTVGEQTKQILNQIETLLEEHGSDKNHILSATVYLKDIALFSQMNEVWDNWVQDGFEPARACVEAALAADSLLVEISVVAGLK